MQIDTTKILKNLKGDNMEMVSSEIVNGREKVVTNPMVFREVITNLLNMENQEHKLTPELKTKAFQIMKKLWDENKADLTLEQRNLIVERAKIFYPTMTAGVIEEFLSPEDKLKPECDTNNNVLA